VYFSTGGANVGLDLVVPGNAFQLSSIDIHIEYSRNESTASLFEFGGLSVALNSSGELLFTYEIYRNPVHSTTVTLGPVTLPLGSSGIFDMISCSYDAASGIGRIAVNGITVRTSDTRDNMALYWNNPGNVTIGRLLDGGGNGFVTLGSVTVYSGQISLTPVELTAFSAAPKTDGILLNWRTETELNNFGFEVQRAVEGTGWERIGFVDGHGSITTPVHYSFTDREYTASAKNTLQYRLKQIDRDGTTEYSPVVTVRTAHPTAFRLEAPYPNPATDRVVAELQLQQESTVQLLLSDVLGRTVSVLTPLTLLPAGVHSFPLPTQALPRGTFFLVATGDAGTLARRLLLH
jgi:hypothetical protein